MLHIGQSWLGHYSNARSIKTRIETDLYLSPLKIEPYSNARSIKTRIETKVSHFLTRNDRIIRMQDPLKQGLKHLFL